MADVSISSLPAGTPAGNNIVPYSTGSDTLGAPVSALFQTVYSNVGIGTSSPRCSLDLGGNLGAGKGFRCGDYLELNEMEGYNNNAYLSMNAVQTGVGLFAPVYAPGQGIIMMASGGGSGSIDFKARNWNNSSTPVSIVDFTQIMRLQYDGNVGIGTTTPETKLDVNGTIKATGLQVPGTVVQVICKVKSDISATSSTSFIDIPGLSASITPKSISNKVMFTGNVFGACSNNAFVRIMRSIGGAAYSQVYTSTSTVGSRTPVSFGDFYMTGSPGNGAGKQNTSIFLDTPETTNEVIYKLQYKTVSASYPFSINSTYYDTNAYYQAIGASSITLMEIAG